MSKKQGNNRALRQLAENLFRELAPGDIPETTLQELTTSLVRQWITYDGHATVLLGDQQVYLILSKTPLGQPCILPEPALISWHKQLIEDWKIAPQDLPEAFEQLNRGQSAEVTNGEGVPLRLWVNPKERSKGVEPLLPESMPPERKRDYHKIASDMVEQHVGAGLDADEREALACSVARQWQKYEGHACLFHGSEQFLFTLTEQAGGTCCVEARHVHTAIEATLGSLGLTAEVIPEVMARINLSHELEFRDRDGVRARLWHDPKAQRLIVQALESGPPATPSEPPLLCPRCSAVLGWWEQGQQKQRCSLCGHTISRS